MFPGIGYPWYIYSVTSSSITNSMGGGGMYGAPLRRTGKLGLPWPVTTSQARMIFCLGGGGGGGGKIVCKDYCV